MYTLIIAVICGYTQDCGLCIFRKEHGFKNVIKFEEIAMNNLEFLGILSITQGISKTSYTSVEKLLQIKVYTATLIVIVVHLGISDFVFLRT